MAPGWAGRAGLGLPGELADGSGLTGELSHAVGGYAGGCSTIRARWSAMWR